MSLLVILASPEFVVLALIGWVLVKGEIKPEW